MNRKVIKPVFRWAGSKQKIVKNLISNFQRKKVYAEPFLGGGSVLLNLLPHKIYDVYIVNDINEAIIELYKNIQRNPLKVINELEKITQDYNACTDKESMYYNVRKEYNDNKNDYVLFWLLMKTGFNGLYRENKKGNYNVPFGKKDKIYFQSDEILKQHRLIQNVVFCSMEYMDFLKFILKQYKKHDLYVYGDPPYCGSQNYYREQFDNDKFALNMLTLKIICSVSDVDSVHSRRVYQRFRKVFVCNIKRSINTLHKVFKEEVLYILDYV